MSALRNSKVWIGGGVVAGVLVIVLAWFVAIGPLMSKASDLNDQRASAEQQNATLQSKVTRLKAQSANINGLNQQLKDAQAALPADSGMADFTRQLNEQAARASVSITSITPTAPTVTSGNPGAPAPAPAPGAVATPGSLFSIPVTVVANGSLAGHRALLSAIENDGPRRALIDSTSFGAGSSSGSAAGAGGPVDAGTTMTVMLHVFVAPKTPAAQADIAKQLGG